MYKPIIAALIAATALVPPALAQDRGRGDRGGEARQRSDNGGQGQRGQWRQQNESRPQAQPRQEAPRGEWRQQTPQVQPQPQRESRGGNGGNNGGWNRGQQAPQAQTPQAPQPSPRWQGNRGNGNTGVVGPQGSPRQDWGNRGNRGDGVRDRGPQGQTRGQQFERRRDNDGRGNGNWSNNGGRNNDGRWNGNNGGRNDGRWNDGRGNNDSRWSNNWRRDSRYNWRNYRSQNRNTYRLPRYYAPRGYNYGYNRFSIGLTLGSLLYSSNYWIEDPFYYRLPPAYGPYRWVRYYNDALLVDIRSGMVVDVEYDIFW